MSAKHHLVVVGDIIVDHHIYEGDREKPTTLNRRGVLEVRETGGSATFCKLLNAVQRHSGKSDWEAILGIAEPKMEDIPATHHAYATWRPFALEPDDKSGAAPEKKKEVWRAHLKLGYGGEAGAAAATTPFAYALRNDLPERDVLVLDDGGFQFRLAAQQQCWLLPKKGEKRPKWILMKMSDPIARGDLWHQLDQKFLDRVVCLISATDLRRESVALSKGLSWERSVDDLRDAFHQNHLLEGLTQCRHLIVTLSADCALWLEREKKTQRARLFFDANGAEGEWAHRLGGEVVGSTTATAASLAYELVWQIADNKAEPDLAFAIESGLRSMRDLMRMGHGFADEKKPPSGYPIERIAEIIARDRDSKAPNEFADAKLDWAVQPGRNSRWSIIETAQRPLDFTPPSTMMGLARQVVIKGLSALKQLPHAKFKKLITTDRREIETLRSIRALMIDYRDDKTKTKPLSIGVFGPPGAGKSFGVEQISNEVFGKESWLKYNLSQFSGPEDLLGAFHKARDLVLEGKTPVVFWDEFDSGDYKWLQYLLAPLQDGRFQEGQLDHAVGRGVFFFAGGTTYTYEEFGGLTARAGPKREARILAKAPDFFSRLDAYYDVHGPNPSMRRIELKIAGNSDQHAKTVSQSADSREVSTEWEPDPEDVGYPLRRALFIRSKVENDAGQALDFDPGLLDALLFVPKYKHGARSLEKLLAPLGLAQGGPVRRSSLPSPAQIAMHVDFGVFSSIMNRNEQFRTEDKIESLAAEIHNTWRERERAARRKIEKDLDCEYQELAEIFKEDNRAAARRIPDVLSLADLAVTKDVVPNPPSDGAVTAQIEHHLERLAEAEHDGWVEQRVRNGWVFAEKRDFALRHHEMIRKYDELPSANKEKDRSSVRNYQQRIADAGYSIVWLSQALP